MVNHVFSRFAPAALTTLGWICFGISALIEDASITKVALLAVARVLP